jgi:hypothetical protein
MVDDDPSKDLSIRNPKITTIISDNNVPTSPLPLSGMIEGLVKISFEAKSFSANNSANL